MTDKENTPKPKKLLRLKKPVPAPTAPSHQPPRQEANKVDFNLQRARKTSPSFSLHSLQRAAISRSPLDPTRQTRIPRSQHTPLARNPSSITAQRYRRPLFTQTTSAHPAPLYQTPKLPRNEPQSQPHSRPRSPAAPIPLYRRPREPFARTQTHNITKTKKPHIDLPSRTIQFTCAIPLSDLAHKMSLPAKKVLQKAKQLDNSLTITSALAPDTAAFLIEEFGHISKYTPAFSTSFPEIPNNNPAPRTPIVTIAGHVDHGKTSILDIIRKTKVTASEHGGITQSIGAYAIQHNNHHITFIDTPGHFAFAKMRAHGIRITDIALLVVAADDSVQEQTIESIKHMQDAKIPIIIVINKIDTPGANPDKVRNDLVQYGVVTDTFGGDTMSVEISAKTGQNISGLLDTILLQAEFLELRAPHTGPARGVILESEIVKGFGPCATILLRRGTLKTGDHFVSGSTIGKVRNITDDTGKRIKSASVSQPVKIAGFTTLPQAGDDFGALDSEREAREIFEARVDKKEHNQSKPSNVDLLAQESITVPVILKAPSYGTLEALGHSLEPLAYRNTKTSIISASIGDVGPTDIELASTAQAEIIAFQVSTPSGSMGLIKEYKVKYTNHKIIYRASEYLQEVLKFRANREILTTPQGEAEVIRIFDTPDVGCIIGCRLISGKVSVDHIAAVCRKEGEIYRGNVSSIQHQNKKVDQGEAGNEYGIMIKSSTGTTYKGVSLRDRIKFYITRESLYHSEKSR